MQIFTCALNSASFRTGDGKQPQFLNCFLLYTQVTPSLNLNELEGAFILCAIINYTLFSGMLCWPFLYSFLASSLRKTRKTVSETCYVLKIMFLLLAVQIHMKPFFYTIKTVFSSYFSEALASYRKLTNRNWKEITCYSFRASSLSSWFSAALRKKILPGQGLITIWQLDTTFFSTPNNLTTKPCRLFITKA